MYHLNYRKRLSVCHFSFINILIYFPRIINFISSSLDYFVNFEIDYSILFVIAISYLIKI